MNERYATESILESPEFVNNIAEPIDVEMTREQYEYELLTSMTGPWQSMATVMEETRHEMVNEFRNHAIVEA